MRQAASRKAGGQGIRYVCEVEGSIVALQYILDSEEKKDET